METQPKQNPFAIPLAIIVAGALIAGSIFFNAQKPSTSSPTTTITEKNIEFAKVTEKDHVLGSLDADAIFIEYSDLECPACKYFQPQMKQMIETYGKDKRMAWVYRHYPLNIHPKAQKEAEAAECVAELSGEAAFWQFIHTVFEVSPANDRLDPAQLPVLAKKVSADAPGFTDAAFATCLNSGKYAEKIAASISDGGKAGVTGTPYTLIVVKKALDKKMQQKVLEAIQTQITKLSPGEILSPETISFDKTGKVVILHAAFPAPILSAILETAAPKN